MSQSKNVSETIIDFEDIKIRLVRKKISSLNLHVKAPVGDVILSAPYRMSMNEILSFLETKKDWIDKHVSEMKRITEQKERHYVTGENVLIWGKRYRLVLIHSSDRKNIMKDDSAGVVIMTANSYSPVFEREELIRKLYREELTKKLAFYVPYWSSITGLCPAECKTRFMTSRWGTCNTATGVICLSLTLCRWDEKYLSYVTLHEIIHLKVPNHGPDFKLLMTHYLPGWRELQKELNEQVYEYTEVRK